jgi:hypothetical protein
MGRYKKITDTARLRRLSLLLEDLGKMLLIQGELELAIDALTAAAYAECAMHPRLLPKTVNQVIREVIEKYVERESTKALLREAD